MPPVVKTTPRPSVQPVQQFEYEEFVHYWQENLAILSAGTAEGTTVGKEASLEDGDGSSSSGKNAAEVLFLEQLPPHLRSRREELCGRDEKQNESEMETKDRQMRIGIVDKYLVHHLSNIGNMTKSSLVWNRRMRPQSRNDLFKRSQGDDVSYSLDLLAALLSRVVIWEQGKHDKHRKILIQRQSPWSKLSLRTQPCRHFSLLLLSLCMEVFCFAMILP